MMKIETVVVGSLETNCYLLSRPGGEEVLLVDPGAQGQRIRERIGKRSVAAVLLTHGHWDHTGALEDFSGVPIYIHAEDAPMLSDPVASGGGLYESPDPRPAATDLLSDGQVLSLAGLTLTVLHTPGHTRGSVCLLGKEDILTGDTLFAGWIPGRTDLPGGSALMMRGSLRTLRQYSGYRIWPGHGEGMVIR